jgi:hypothetical protein
MKISTALLFSLPLWLIPAAAQDVRVGLVAYWPLDEVSGDGLTTPDKAPLQTNLTLFNMTADNLVPGQRGNGMTFNGSNQLLWADTSTGTNPGLPLQNSVRKTICLWIKADGSAQQDRRFFAEASMATNAPMFNLGTDSAATGRTGKVDVFIRNDANAATVNHAKSVGTPLDNTWRHVAVTDDNGVVRFYFDGVLDASTLSYTRPAMTVNTISLGGIMRQSGAAGLFTGAVDDVAVWNRILTPAEINEVRTNGIATPVPPLVVASRLGPYRQGDRVRFSLETKGIVPTTWQWRRNGVDIDGATESTYTTPALSSALQGEYTVLVNGSQVSSTVNVAVTDDPAANVTNNLVSWWPFNTVDVSAFPTTTPDPWGGHPLSCTDIDATALVPGQFGTAMEFDGLTRIASRTTGFPIAGNPEYSVALWVKGDGLTQSDLRVFAEGSNTTNTPLFTLGTTINSSDKLRIYVRSDANVAVEGISTAPVFDDTWHHVVWTDRNGVGRLYVDGVLDLTTVTYNRAASVYTLNQTSVGAVQRAVPTSWCRSTIDDVAVWNRALTWTEIQSIKTAGVPAPVAAVPPDVTQQPVGRTLWAGRPLTLSIQATGTAPFTYQWFRDNNPVPTGTEATLVLDPAAAGDSGTYFCRVTNGAGADDSGTAVVVVKAINNLDSGRVSAWPLETGDPTTPDTLFANDLTLTGFAGIEPWQAAVKDNGGFFDGVDDILVRTRTLTGNDQPLTNREEFTVTFWVRGQGAGQLDRRVFAEGSTSNTNPLFTMGTDTLGVHDKMNLYFRGDGGAVPVNHRAGTLPVFDGFWHHVIYTDYLGQARLYVDGVLDSSFTYARPVRTLNTVSLGGIQRATAAAFFKGGMDEVNTWERALSETEVLALYASQPKPPQTLDITGITVPSEGLLQFTISTSYGNADYRLQSSTTLAANSWADETGVSIGQASGGVVTIDLAATLTGRKFYRVIIPEPPPQ